MSETCNCSAKDRIVVFSEDINPSQPYCARCGNWILKSFSQKDEAGKLLFFGISAKALALPWPVDFGYYYYRFMRSWYRQLKLKNLVQSDIAKVKWPEDQNAEAYVLKIKAKRLFR